MRGLSILLSITTVWVAGCSLFVDLEDVEVCEYNDSRLPGDDYQTWYADIDGDGFGDSEIKDFSCLRPEGFVMKPGDCDDTNPELNPDGEDCQSNDCGINNQKVLYPDNDGDGYGDAEGVRTSCIDLPDFVSRDGDCDDQDVHTFPGAEELCDGIDNDCDGDIDEGLDMNTYYLDADGDGYGDDEETLEACFAPEGYSEVGGDCEDDNRQIHPNLDDLCDEVDNDCDGDIDEDENPTVYFLDSDSDGFGDREQRVVSCTQLSGLVINSDDCDDTNADINPDAIEICDGIDNDCQNGVDDGVEMITSYLDADGDGYASDDAEPFESCEIPEGNVTERGDCDDEDGARAPDLFDDCDGIDTNCDGNIDEEAVFSAYYVDNDGDGYGDRNQQPTMLCEMPVSGFSVNRLDCNDDDIDINPGATEICDDIDDNCDGDLFDGLTTQWYFVDEDGDGYGTASETIEHCQLPDGYSEFDNDCDDDPITGVDVSPAGQEIVVGEGIEPGSCAAFDLCADGKDNDCDGDFDMDDWDCQDIDSDNIPNGVDSYWEENRVGVDSVNETLCIAAWVIFPDAYAQHDAVLQGTPINSVDPEASWRGYENLYPVDLLVPAEEILESGGKMAYCLDFTFMDLLASYSLTFRLTSAQSSVDVSMPVNASDCADWLSSDLYCTSTVFTTEKFRFGSSAVDCSGLAVGWIGGVLWTPGVGFDRL